MLNYKNIIIGVLILILVLGTCNHDKIFDQKVKTEIKTDTIYKKITDTIEKKVVVYKTLPPVIPNKPQYQPSENIDTCNARFKYLANKHFTRNVYIDSVKIEDYGYVTVKDTVWMNTLQKREYSYNLNIPIVKETITQTITKPPVTQVYLGGELFGDTQKLQIITPGILLKTRKDIIYKANVGINFDGSLTYGGGIYYKIKFGK